MPIIAPYKKFWVGFDRHAPESDPEIDKIVTEFLGDFKPTIRIAGGDWMTIDQVSNFENEGTTHLADEFEMTREILERWKITHYLEGNHEERLRRVGTKLDSRLRSLCDVQTNLHLKELGIKFLPWHPIKGVLEIGKLKILHGFYANEYVAAKTARTYGTCVFGHAHRFQTFWPKAAFNNHVGYSIGMLGRLDQTYTESRPPMGWAQGFAFGYIHRSGWFDLYQARIVGDRIAIEGKVYRRRGR